ncbi:MAG: hypothetical protein LBB88_08495 [Planctomycetaceae bacterium]|jgi:hypothetical protein|nr:hypothetical protein [Planctomycetaceae bacterium]
MEINKIVKTADSSNKINGKTKNGRIFSYLNFCLLAILLSVAGFGCSTISKCDPCAAVDSDSGGIGSGAKYNLIYDLFYKSRQRKSFQASSPSASQQTQTDNSSSSRLKSIYDKNRPSSNDSSINSSTSRNNSSTKKSKSGSMSYLTIPPPPESPE